MFSCLNGVTAGGGLPFEEFVQLAAVTGFRGAEFPIEAAAAKADEGALDAFREVFSSRNVRMGAWGLPVEFRRDEETFQAGLTRLPRLAAVARELGTMRTCTWIAPSSDDPYEERWAFLTGRLSRVVEILRGEGVHFGIEFVGPKTSRGGPHEFMYTMREALKMGEDLGGDHVGLLLDSFHWYTSGATVAEIEALPAEKIVHVHINDAPDRPRDEQIDFQRLLPGEGIIDLVGFLTALKRIGYDGPVSVETFSDELKTLTPTEAATRASRCLQGVFAKAGIVDGR